MKLTNLSEAPGETEAPPRAFRRFAAVRTGSQLIPGVRPLVEREDVGETRAADSGSRRGRVGCGECALEPRRAAMVRVARGRRNGRVARRLWAVEWSHVGFSAVGGREAQ
jgi:hypothetical protein